jgi:hypothetical protein
MILYDQTATASTNPQGLIQKAWVHFKGNNSWPTPGQAKYMVMLMVANRLKNNWARDSKVHWDSLFVQRTYGPIIASQQAYDLDSDVFYLSDFVYVLRTDGNTDRFQVVHPESRNKQFSPVGQIGSDNGDPITYLTGSNQGGDSNLTLNFQTPFSEMPGDVGGTIQVGCYAQPDDMLSPGDTVPVNDPEWLVMALAAEMARNDPSKQDQYPDILAQATDLYGKMVLDNQGNSYQQPSGPAYVMQNIGLTWEQT